MNILGANVKIVGKNFDDVVMNSDADVFIKMYAPWCGHCKQLAPQYQKAAQALKVRNDDYHSSQKILLNSDISHVERKT